MTTVSSGSDKVTGSPDPDQDREGFYRLLLAAAELVDALGDRAEAERASYEAGWRDAAEAFFRHGHEVGYAQAHEEMAAAWKSIAEKVRATAATPTFEELQRRRTGGADTGGPVEWEPKVAEVIELKRGVA